MSDEKIQYEVHDYDPLNKYIDERSRIKRTRSVWGYTRSLALFLIALGIFLILAAYAYHIFKKPHLQLIEENNTQTERQVNDLIEKDKEIKDLKKQIESNPENEILKNKLKKIEEEKAELEKELEKKNEKIVDGKKVVYIEDPSTFKSTTQGEYTIKTGFSWETVDDMRYGEPHTETWCYLTKAGYEGHTYWFNKDTDQSSALKMLDMTKSQAESYEKYCAN